MKAAEMNKSLEDLPPTGINVVVQCKGFGCLGYLDETGTWKNAFTHEVLPEVISFSPLGASVSSGSKYRR